MSRSRLAKHRVIALLPARIECSGSLYLDGKGIKSEFIPARELAPGSEQTQRLVLTDGRPSMYEDTYDMRDGMTCFATFHAEVTNRIPNPYLLNPFTPEEIARIEIRWQPHLESVKWRRDGETWIATFDGRDVGGYGPAEGGKARWTFGDLSGEVPNLDAAETAFVDAWVTSIFAMAAPASYPIKDDAA